MQDNAGYGWTVGAIANGHVLTAEAGWVRLNARTSTAGPWRPGDVVEGSVYTGSNWTQLPGAWLPDPTGRYQLRWWTGRHWAHHAMTDGLRFYDPLASPVHQPAQTLPAKIDRLGPPVPRRSPRGFWDVVDRVAVGTYCCFWLIIAVASAAVAGQEHEPRLLLLTSTASMNIFLFMLTGKKRKQLREQLRNGAMIALKKALPFAICGALTVGGAWLSVHFDDPQILMWTAFVVAVALMFAWAFS